MKGIFLVLMLSLGAIVNVVAETRANVGVGGFVYDADVPAGFTGTFGFTGFGLSYRSLFEGRWGMLASYSIGGVGTEVRIGSETIDVELDNLLSVRGFYRLSRNFSVGVQRSRYEVSASDRLGRVAPITASDEGTEVVAIFHNENRDWEISLEFESDYRLARASYFFQ